MDAAQSPFTPNAGSRPPALPGRDAVLKRMRIACARSMSHSCALSPILKGVRGTGKTVLLKEASKIANAQGMLISKFEGMENANVQKIFAAETRKLLFQIPRKEAAAEPFRKAVKAVMNFASAYKVPLRNFGLEILAADSKESLGVADSGIIESDLRDLVMAIGKAVSESGKGWAICIDELQVLPKKELSALISAIHAANQASLPVLLIGAGLPQLNSLLISSKSYAERMFIFEEIGRLKESDAKDAIRIPLEEHDCTITDEALTQIVKDTDGYPYFLQVWGTYVWTVAQSKEITLRDVQAAAPLAIEDLDNNFFDFRTARLTPSEIEFLCAMRRVSEYPVPVGEIARKMGRSAQSISPSRARLIKKGIIHANQHGFLSYSVPLFKEYISRHYLQEKTP